MPWLTIYEYDSTDGFLLWHGNCNCPHYFVKFRRTAALSVFIQKQSENVKLCKALTCYSYCRRWASVVERAVESLRCLWPSSTWWMFSKVGLPRTSSKSLFNNILWFTEHNSSQMYVKLAAGETLTLVDP